MSNADTVPAAIAAPQPRQRRAGTIETGIGAAIVLGWLIAALGANWLAPADPNALDLMAVLAPQARRIGSAPTTLAAMCCRASSTAPGSTSGWALSG